MRTLLLALVVTPALFLGVQRTEAIRPTCGAGLAIVYSLPRERAHELCPVILERVSCNPYLTKAICRRFP